MGKNPQQVQSALQQGNKLLPNAFKQIKDIKSGSKFLEGLGIDKSFIDQQFAKYSPYLSKIGMDANVAAPIVEGIKNEMKDNKSSTEPTPTKGTFKKFDPNRYPKI